MLCSGWDRHVVFYVDRGANVFFWFVVPPGRRRYYPARVGGVVQEFFQVPNVEVSIKVSPVVNVPPLTPVVLFAVGLCFVRFHASGSVRGAVPLQG